MSSCGRCVLFRMLSICKVYRSSRAHKVYKKCCLASSGTEPQRSPKPARKAILQQEKEILISPYGLKGKIAVCKRELWILIGLKGKIAMCMRELWILISSYSRGS